MDYGFFMDFKSILDYGFFMEWIWIWILKNMGYGMDMDLVLNPSGPTAVILLFYII